MLERFTTPARDAVMRARTEAKSAKHRFIGTEHLLIALLDPAAGRTAEILGEFGLDLAGVRATVGRLTGDRPDIDADALKSIGIDLDAVIASVERTFGPGALDEPTDPEPVKGLFGRRLRSAGPTPRFTARARKVLELAVREAAARKDGFIGSEHLLLGVIREGEGLGAKILADAGIDFAVLRSRLSVGIVRPDAA